MKFISTLFISALVLTGEPRTVNAEEGEVSAPAVTRLSLDECIKRAVASSHTLAASRHRLAALDAKIKQLLWAPFSNINMSAFGSVVPDQCIDKVALESEGVLVGCNRQVDRYGNVNGSIDDEYDYADKKWGPTFRFQIGATIPLYTFGKMSNGKDALEHGFAAKQAQHPMLEHKIRYQVMQAYHAIMGAREMLYTIGQGRKFLKKTRAKVEKDLENQEGTSTDIDLIKLKVFEGEVTQYETQSLEIERVGLAALRFLVGGDNREQIDILDVPQEKEKNELKSLAEYKETALDHRPELKAVRHAVKALESKVELRKAEFWPDLVFVGGIRYAATPGRTDIQTWGVSDSYNYGPGYYFGLALNYKFDLGLDINKLKEAKAELAAITTDQQAALEGIMVEVERTYHHAIASRDALDGRQESKRLVKGWVSAVMQNQAAGLGSAKEVKDALAEYFKVMAGIHMLTHDFNVSVAEMNRVTGVFLPSN